ncbi:MAG: hypothetical protein P4L53_25525 [Candidatus Obscuribacterales bacterium]|nr:hypothetical protein [Candidatus Obscuribacterales bacterium]
MPNLVRLTKLVIVSFLVSVFQCVQAAEQTPTQFYLQFHQKCLAVSSPKALFAWRSKDSIARDQPMTDDEIEAVYPMIKDMMSKKVTVISEEIKGDRATLKVTGEVPNVGDLADAAKSSKPVKKGVAETAATKPAAAKPEQAVGVVLLVKEDGQWKMDHESWTVR